MLGASVFTRVITPSRLNARQKELLREFAEEEKRQKS